MAQRSIPAPFLTKTYEMVDDRSTDDVISWNGDGTSFVVWKTADFSKDLLPKYFKHNNFSSFIRQLNTYGFRKVVPDKWEFANEHFRKSQKELLFEIRRRKASSAAKTLGGSIENTCNAPPPPLNFGDDMGSTSTASQDLKDHHSSDSVETSTQFVDLSGENEKLKRDNETLLTELAQTKKQCDELIAFLTRYEKLVPDQINHILRLVSLNDHTIDDAPTHDKTKDDDDNVSLKLFGVWLKKTNKKGAVMKILGPTVQRKLRPWTSIIRR